MVAVNWNNFNPAAYILDNYAKIHDEDRQIIQFLVKFYSKLPTIRHALEVGVGPNLYPLMAMLPYVKKIDCIDVSNSNMQFFREQLKNPSQNWNIFWEFLQDLSSKYAKNFKTVLLKKVETRLESIYDLKDNNYDLVSTNFCLESITDNNKEFELACHKFIESSRQNGYLLASFMENSQGYEVGGVKFPGHPVNRKIIYNIFYPRTKNLKIRRISAAEKPLREGYTGMLVLSAQKK